jgi:hypothetical protein
MQQKKELHHPEAGVFAKKVPDYANRADLARKKSLILLIGQPWQEKCYLFSAQTCVSDNSHSTDSTISSRHTHSSGECGL